MHQAPKETVDSWLRQPALDPLRLVPSLLQLQHAARDPLAPKKPHFPGPAKAVIYLFMAGAPSQLELFEPKPELNKLHGQKVPESFTKGKRFAFIKGDAKLLGSARKFDRYGACGMHLSELFPYHREIVDEVFEVGRQVRRQVPARRDGKG